MSSCIHLCVKRSSRSHFLFYLLLTGSCTLQILRWLNLQSHIVSVEFFGGFFVHFLSFYSPPSRVNEVPYEGISQVPNWCKLSSTNVPRSRRKGSEISFWWQGVFRVVLWDSMNRSTSALEQQFLMFFFYLLGRKISHGHLWTRQIILVGHQVGTSAQKWWLNASSLLSIFFPPPCFSIGLSCCYHAKDNLMCRDVCEQVSWF